MSAQLKRILGFTLLAGLIAGCSGGATSEDEGSEEDDIAAARTAYWVASEASGEGHLAIQRANPGSMKALCADGSHAESCPVAKVDWSALKLADKAEADASSALANHKVVMRGKLSRVGGKAVLRVTDAWVGKEETTLGATDALWKTNLTSQACTTEPCQAHALYLNSTISDDVAAVDFSKSKLSKKEIAAAREALSVEPVVFLGDWNRGGEGNALRLYATKVYVALHGS